MPTLAPTMPAGLQTILAQSLQRLTAGSDDIQKVIHTASETYAAPGNSHLALWWALYADKGRVSLRTQYLYVQREMLADVERRLFEWTSFGQGGVTQSNSDLAKAISTMRMEIQADIDLLEKQIQASRVPRVGVMTNDRLGLSPTYGQPDPNDARYRGDPLARPLRFYPNGW